MINVKKLNLKKGASMVEIIVSLAIFSLIFVFFLAIFSSYLQTVSNNSRLSRQDEDAASGIENSLAKGSQESSNAVVNSLQGEFVISFGAASINQSGEFVISRDTDAKSEFYYFEPDRGD